MRWIGPLLVPLVLVGAAVASTPAARERPALRVISWSPLAVQGLHFARRERVRVTAELDEAARVRTARANRLGRFGATFGYLAYDPCNSTLAVWAVGNMGSRAAIKLPQRQCLPARRP